MLLFNLYTAGTKICDIPCDAIGSGMSTGNGSLVWGSQAPANKPWRWLVIYLTKNAHEQWDNDYCSLIILPNTCLQLQCTVGNNHVQTVLKLNHLNHSNVCFDLHMSNKVCPTWNCDSTGKNINDYLRIKLVVGIKDQQLLTNLLSVETIHEDHPGNNNWNRLKLTIKSKKCYPSHTLYVSDSTLWIIIPLSLV